MDQPERSSAPGVIFDLDGTLADTLQDITDAVNAALAHADLTPQTPERVRAFVGDGLPTLIRRAAGIIEPDRIADLVERFREHYHQNYLRHTRLYPRLSEVLTALQQAGCPMAVLSNKPDDFTKAICRSLLTRWQFVACDGTCLRYPNKPDPTRARQLAGCLERPPDRVVLIGDSDVDVQTAHNAGMRSVAVTWGFRDRGDLEAAGPDSIVDRPEQLPAAVLT